LLFRDKDASLFRTTCLYDRGADAWEWRMDAEQNGTTKPCTRVRLVSKQQRRGIVLKDQWNRMRGAAT
jgi:hypothetical protein